MDATVRIRPSLTLSVTRDNVPTTDVTLNLDPASNPFDSEDLNIAVSTNNKTGYTLTMTTLDNGTNLVNVADSTKTIPTLTSSTTAAAFPVNKWGYKKDSGNYQPFVTNTQILTNNTRTNEDATTLSFAAKVDYTKESGLYKQDLVFAATPNMVTYYMQDLDPAVCSKDPIEAIDLRDGNTYWVAELDDGNCWMLQNLQLGNTLATTSGSMTLTPDDSNVSQNWTLTNKIPSPGNMPLIHIPDDVSGESEAVYNNSAFYCAPDGTNQYKSCYYNWHTATAGSGTSNVTGKDTTGVDVNDSICPSGWVLPRNADFQTLYDEYQSPIQMLVNPNESLDNIGGSSLPGFLLSGIYGNTGSSLVGATGTYWSRSAYSTGRSYFFGINKTVVRPQNNHSKYEGIAVRCLRETRKIGDIENMQDISPAIVANTNEGSFKALKDTRDNQYYMVSKLKDGKIWMLQNLRLGTNLAATSGSLTLTPMDSDITTNYILDNKLPSQGNMPYSVIDPDDRYISPSGGKASNPYDGNAFYCTPGDGIYYVGCYYNWWTTTASRGTSDVTPVGTSLGYKDVDNASICPKGWHLPTGGRASGDFKLLYDQYPSPIEMINPNPCTYSGEAGCDNSNDMYIPGFTLGGVDALEGVLNVSKGGFYWSRSAYSKGLAYGLNLSSSSVSSQDYFSNKFRGFSIRCLAY